MVCAYAFNTDLQNFLRKWNISLDQLPFSLRVNEKWEMNSLSTESILRSNIKGLNQDIEAYKSWILELEDKLNHLSRDYLTIIDRVKTNLSSVTSDPSAREQTNDAFVVDE